MHCMWRVCGAADLIAGAHAFTVCVCVCVSAPSPRRPARGDASPATPHAPRVVTHVAHACACARVDSSSRPPPRRAYMAHAHACEARLSLLRNLTLRVWWPTSRMHGACAHRRRRTCSSGQGGASRLGARRPRPPSRSLLSPALAGTCPSGGTVLFCPQQAGYARTVAGLRVGPRECA